MLTAAHKVRSRLRDLVDAVGAARGDDSWMLFRKKHLLVVTGLSLGNVQEEFAPHGFHGPLYFMSDAYDRASAQFEVGASSLMLGINTGTW